MNGASMAVEPPRWAIPEMVVLSRFPVAGSSWTSLMPVQNEPSDSHQRPCPSTTRLGSMALKLSELAVAMTRPWLVHEPEAPVVLVARKIAEVLEPNVEAA